MVVIGWWRRQTEEKKRKRKGHKRSQENNGHSRAFVTHQRTQERDTGHQITLLSFTVQWKMYVLLLFNIYFILNNNNNINSLVDGLRQKLKKQ